MTFTSTVEEINATRLKLKILVPWTTLKNICTAVANEIQSTKEIKGFRKGKAPMPLVQKFFKGDIIKESVDRAVKDSYAEAVKNVEAQVVSYPHIEFDDKIEEEKDLHFSATIDINPKIEIKDYFNLNITLDEKLKFDEDSQVNDFLKTCQKMFGSRTPAPENHSVEKSDILKINIRFSSRDGDLPVKELKNHVIHLDGSQPAEFENALLGLKVGESKVFTIDYPENHDDKNLSNKTVEHRATLLEIQTFEEAELNDDLMAKLGHTSLDDAKTKLKEMFVKNNSDLRADAAFDHVVDCILEKNQFEVAESLVDSAVDQLIQEHNRRNAKENAQDAQDPSTRAKYVERAIKQVRGILALGYIAQQENISIDADELTQSLSSLAIQNSLNPQEFFKKVGKQFIEEFRGRVMVRKVISYLIDKAQVQYVAKTLNNVKEDVVVE